MKITPEMMVEDEKRWHDRDVITELGYCGNCMRDRKNMTNLDIRFYAYIMRKAHEMLKAREPRVMTLEELWDVGRVWKSSVPPFLWLDKNRSIYNSIGFWCPWRDIYEMIHGRHDKYTDENYGSEWRCWTSCPTPEQMRETSWEGEGIK